MSMRNTMNELGDSIKERFEYELNDMKEVARSSQLARQREEKIKNLQWLKFSDFTGEDFFI